MRQRWSAMLKILLGDSNYLVVVAVDNYDKLILRWCYCEYSLAFSWSWRQANIGKHAKALGIRIWQNNVCVSLAGRLSQRGPLVSVVHQEANVIHNAVEYF